jgi:hypothetical protein
MGLKGLDMSKSRAMASVAYLLWVTACGSEDHVATETANAAKSDAGSKRAADSTAVSDGPALPRPGDEDAGMKPGPGMKPRETGGAGAEPAKPGGPMKTGPGQPMAAGAGPMMHDRAGMKAPPPHDEAGMMAPRPHAEAGKKAPPPPPPGMMPPPPAAGMKAPQPPAAGGMPTPPQP